MDGGRGEGALLILNRFSGYAYDIKKDWYFLCIILMG